MISVIHKSLDGEDQVLIADKELDNLHGTDLNFTFADDGQAVADFLMRLPSGTLNVVIEILRGKYNNCGRL